MNVVRAILLFIAMTVLAGCAGSGGLGSMSKVNELQRGMTTEEVKALLGEPGGVQLIDGLPIWRYSLHEYFVGWVPHYLVFNKKNRLVGWQSNMDEYYANQMMWKSAIQSMQRSSQDLDAQRSRSAGTGSGSRDDDRSRDTWRWIRTGKYCC